MSGYISSQNEYEFQNIRVNGTLISGGKQLCIQRHEKGPILSLTGSLKAHNDLMVIKACNGNDILKITCEGYVFVNGVILTNEPTTSGSGSGLSIVDHTLDLGRDTSIIFENEVTLNKSNLILNPINPINDGIILGNPEEDSSWKITLSESGDLIFMKRVNGEWVYRHCIN
jgi:hypothetical protein